MCPVESMVDADVSAPAGAFACAVLKSHNRVVASRVGESSGSAFKCNTFIHGEPHEGRCPLVGFEDAMSALPVGHGEALPGLL